MNPILENFSREEREVGKRIRSYILTNLALNGIINGNLTWMENTIK